MTLEERKRIVNLAMEANEVMDDIWIHCHCYGSGAVTVPVVVKWTGEDLMRFHIRSSDTSDSTSYRKCETYLKELLKKGDKDNGNTKENPERQTTKADSESHDKSSRA